MTVAYTGTKDQPVIGGVPSFEADIAEIMLWLMTGRAFRKFATQAAMIAASTVDDNDIAQVDTIDGAFFKYDGSAGIWRMHGSPRFADASARTTAITTPATGMRSTIGTRQFVYAGSSWHRDGFLTPTVHASTGSSATVSEDGVVVMTALTAITLKDIDPTLFGCDDVEYVIEGTSAAGAITMLLANAGTADTSSNYDWFGNGENIGSTDQAVTSPDTAFWPISNGVSPVEFLGEVRLHNAKSATRKTRGFGRFLAVTTAETAKTQVLASMDHASAASFDGIRLTFASAFTGTITVQRRG